jgi:hypothetical protein
MLQGAPPASPHHRGKAEQAIRPKHPAYGLELSHPVSQPVPPAGARPGDFPSRPTLFFNSPMQAPSLSRRNPGSCIHLLCPARPPEAFFLGERALGAGAGAGS